MSGVFVCHSSRTHHEFVSTRSIEAEENPELQNVMQPSNSVADAAKRNSLLETNKRLETQDVQSSSTSDDTLRMK